MQKYYGVIENKRYFKYYDTISLNINGNAYQGIILDSCGACSKKETNILDLFVAGSYGSVGKTKVSIE